jgi:Mn-dependent DtxR family transcriptional regulator
MLSPSLEEHLIQIYKMSTQGEELKSSEICKALGVPLKKTIQALQRMHYQKLLLYLPYQPLSLTPKGEDMAKFLISRNKLVDDFLEILQITQNIETEKEMMQNNFSYETLKALERLTVFMHQYPEVLSRYRLFSKRKLKVRILEPLPEEEKL